MGKAACDVGLRYRIHIMTDMYRITAEEESVIENEANNR